MGTTSIRGAIFAPSAHRSPDGGMHGSIPGLRIIFLIRKKSAQRFRHMGARIDQTAMSCVSGGEGKLIH